MKFKFIYLLLFSIIFATFLVSCSNTTVIDPGEETAPPKFEAPLQPLNEATVSALPTVTNTPLPPTTTPRPTPSPEPTVVMSVLQNIIPEEPPEQADIEVIATDLDDPVAFVVAPDGRIFFTEKVTGNVRVIVDGQLLPEPVINVVVGSNSEQGLLGITVDPDFEQNHYIWITHTVPARENDGVKVNRVVRFTEQNNKAVDVVTALELPNSEGDGTHNMNNLAFGPDGKLYITAGEDNDANNAQNLDDPRGKILRFNPTIPLTAPEDNPFHDGDGPHFDGIYAYGFRNSFDFVFDPLHEDVRIFATENGPSCDDEVNLVLAGNNYGWHRGHDCDNENGTHPELNNIDPLWYSIGTISPTGITVYTGDDFPQWHGDLFFCSYVDGKLHHLILNKARDSLRHHYSINGLFCQTDVFNGPDGSLYFLEGGGYGPGTLKRLYNATAE